MKFKEVLALEKGNCSEIRLYHEGMFWRAYERSAFMLCSQVKPLKVTKRVAKSIGGEAICMVGFPVGSFESICGGVEALERTERDGASCPICNRRRRIRALEGGHRLRRRGGCASGCRPTGG